MIFNIPFSLQRKAIYLLETHKRNQSDMLLLAASLTLNQGAVIIDGGNHFNAYSAIKSVRFATTNLAELNRLQLARAFNCHQIVTLSEQISFDGRPALFIDILSLFQDDNVPYTHRIYLLKKMVHQLKLLARQAPVFVSLPPPKEAYSEWNFMATIVRKASGQILEEGFMGKTLPTINQIIQQAEVILARFSHTLQPEERSAMDLLFNHAKKHIAAISEANHLIPFEAAQQAILLEQQKEIVLLQKKLSEIEVRLGSK